MARPRKPTSVLEFTGAFKKHPERRRQRANEPQQDEELGDPPDQLNEAQAARWKDIVADCPEGVLRRADRMAVEMAARLWTKLRDGTAKPAEVGILSSLLGRLGMTPADRSKVSVVKPAKPKGNAFGAIG